MFRVEKADGAGPYMSDDDALRHMFYNHSDAEHPQPADDPLLLKGCPEEGIYPDEVCGFPTLCALEEWFAGYEDPLADAGYEIAVYSVELQHVRYGTHQAVFVRGDSYPVRNIPILS